MPSDSVCAIQTNENQLIPFDNTILWGALSSYKRPYKVVYYHTLIVTKILASFDPMQRRRGVSIRQERGTLSKALA